MDEIDHEAVDYFVEIKGLYGGWAFAVMKDGTAVNRWEQSDRRYEVTQESMRQHMEWRYSRGHKRPDDKP